MKKIMFIVLSSVFAAVQPVSATEQITLTSLDWPPFSSPAITGGGMTSLIVKQAFARVGYELNVEVEPWSTAVARAENTEEVAGYFPAYYSEERAKKCVFSDEIGTSLVGFAKRNGEEYHTSLEALAEHVVGVVSGYANEENFDSAVSDGRIPVVKSGNDVENIHQLLDGRVDLAVVDKRVMNYLVSNDKTLNEYKGKVKFDPAGLKMHGLYVCFTGSRSGEYAQALARGLKSLDPMGFGLANDPMYRNRMNK
ncbi:MAG: hypothetical protein CMI08_06165 [Oceanospirillaceae bacterium]|nr:hypothetical protein [Thalassolituus sp.]MAS25628.1 hypothetical protein [Oceanospirillaceae bacterium]MAX98780.1 hypothetical protein [Oceanospirillaceae bacterium]MBL35688.1 hypothetical protein [Oceanospirillaceae bacterium]MBS52217.1 hypothetical protein [Oceanospirillaceae bacterium]|tara:strand:+ start:192 stop:950 length:759 start_codon:yes stop_codon:yes gene_type:complete